MALRTSPPNSCSAKAKSFSVVTFRLLFLARHRFHRKARQLRNGDIVGGIGAGMIAMRLEDLGETKALRGLGALQARRAAP